MTSAPYLWTRRPKIIEPRDPVICRPRMSGRYKLEAVRPDGRKRLLADWFSNVITDAGLDMIGATLSISTFRVGTGAAQPDVTDTGLQTQVSSASREISTSSGADQGVDRYTYERVTRRFAAGAATGNIAEVGVGSVSTLFSRALILDGGGQATTITVAADEALDVTYELRSYPPLSDMPAVVDIGGTDTDIVVRTANVGGWTARYSSGNAGTWILYSGDATLGAVTGNPSASQTAQPSSSSNNSDYSPGSYLRAFSRTYGLLAANLSGGIGALRFGCGTAPFSRTGCLYQVSFDPPIPKTGSNEMTLNFQHSWARR